MEEEQFDLLVIGGGITGAGVARDAAMRGLRTALVDKGDFGAGTSSQSSRLIHGGLRYLEHRHWRLVFEASRERRTLLRIAPHLVWPRSFLFPVYDDGRVPRWKLGAGLWLYDLLALFRNVNRHERLSKRELLRAEPGLRSRGLKGGARYFDAQCDDARLTLANVRDAHRQGAAVANYARVDRIDKVDGQARGAEITDLVTGEGLRLRAHVVVNATGPWTDALRRDVDGDEPILRTSKGAHVAVLRRRVGNHEALTLTSPIDGRVMFIIPWGDLSYIGTTETEGPTRPDDVRADADDVVYLLRSANAVFPGARLTPEDVVATWAGLRPLVRSLDGQDPGSVSREHRVLDGRSGLISIVGGKLTTYRVMAADTVDRVAARLHEMDGRPAARRAPTDREPLPGGQARNPEVLVEDAEQEGVSRAVAEHLVRAHGSETPAVVRLARERRELADPVVPELPVLRAELVHCMRREMAITLGDLLIRRTHVFHRAAGHAADQAPAVAELAASEMGWDRERVDAELQAYRHEVARADAFRSELGARPE